MKQHSIIIGIIFFSLLSWALGAFWITHIMHQNHTNETPQISSIDNNQIKNKENSLENLQTQITQNIAEIAPSVVSIIVKKDLVIYRSDPWGFFQEPAGSVQRKVWWGSWFFVSEEGIILTNKHVVSDPNAEYTVILHDGTEYNAQVLAFDPINDLAIIQIKAWEENFQTLPLISDSANIQVGEFVLAIGNALSEFQNSVSLGIISGKDRTIEAGSDTLSGLLQTDAAINPGNSGGPLIDLDGNAIGINTAIASRSTGIGFAISLTQDKLDYMLESISEHGRIKRPFIGINFIPNSPGVAAELKLPVDYGAYIIDEEESVILGSSAEKSWLEPGDIILEINENKINTQQPLGKTIQNSIPGDILKLTVLKKTWEEKNINLELGEY